MIKGYSTYKHFINHSWLARGRGAKPWDHTRPTYPMLPPQSVRHAPEITNTFWKIKHSQKNTIRYTRYSLTQKDDSKHTLKSSHVSCKSKTQRYRSVTHLLVRRKADIRDASQTGNTRKDDSNTQKQPHQLQTNARAELLLHVHGNNSEYTYSKVTCHSQQ